LGPTTGGSWCFSCYGEKGSMISRNMFPKSSPLKSIFEDFESLEFLAISEPSKIILLVVSRAGEGQTTPSLQTTANEQELAFPCLRRSQRLARHWNMRKGLFGLARRLAAANRTACLAFCANACAENVQWGGGVWPGEGLYDLRESVWEGELPRVQPSERAAG